MKEITLTKGYCGSGSAAICETVYEGEEED